MAHARLRRAWRTFVDRTGWTPPTTTEIATIGKAALASSLAWVVASAVTDVPDPVLAPLAALITVRLSVYASVRHALQRSAAVVLGVLVAVVIGDAIGLNALTVGLLTGGSLAVAVLVLRLPRQAANQVPVSVLVVMAALATRHATDGWERALNTVIGAAVGAAVSIAFPASRLNHARQTLERLGTTLSDVIEAMGNGVGEAWASKQSAEWRTKAHVARDRLVNNAKDAIGSGQEAAQWNIRDRRHADELGRYEAVLPRVERTAIGVPSIARGLDDDARSVAGGELPPMKAMSALLVALGDLVRAVVRNVLAEGSERDVELSFTEVALRRQPCAQAASTRALGALREDIVLSPDRPGLQWLSYAALLVQIDRVVDDLAAPTASPSA